jgi:hypothetical protein
VKFKPVQVLPGTIIKTSTDENTVGTYPTRGADTVAALAALIRQREANQQMPVLPMRPVRSGA